MIIHGTDSLEYTASALSFLIDNLDKTIIVTGSQVPLSMIKNDARNNLIGCFRVLIMFNFRSVLIYFNNEVFRGTVCKKIDAKAFQGFGSPCFPLVRDEL